MDVKEVQNSDDIINAPRKLLRTSAAIFGCYAAFVLL
jgi:hypothetical protein